MFQETKELPATETKTGKYHELAEAIRRGCLTTKPLRASYVDKANKYAEYACALGAAALAKGYDGWCPVSDYLRYTFGKIWDDKIDGLYLHDMITSRNDMGMRREAIADWLDRL